MEEEIQTNEEKFKDQSQENNERETGEQSETHGSELYKPLATDKEGEVSIPSFKKPVLIGKIGRLPRKVGAATSLDQKLPTVESQDVNVGENKNYPEISTEPDVHEAPNKPIKAPAQQLTENSMPLPYKEPSWSGLPRSGGKDYVFEVLKSGVIVEQINLMPKPFWVFGRSTNCEIYMAHPTISRYHAVLQYRDEGSQDEPPGFYIYDLNSTHGTFLNKGRLKPRVYAPLKVGHMLKLGFSSRSYVLTGPEEDTEEESEFTVTELKQQRTEKLLREEEAKKEAQSKEEQEMEEKRKKEEVQGVDWGLGEDADADADLADNPYAQTNNEELYIDDPKKALRGFMEREGYDLEYDCSEQGFGQFLCKVELPIDDERGRPIVAEVLHKGKKKEAVIQCALEACKILDRHGVLRQATHESRKRKAKNWEENDYYDSDDDPFLDRTGTIEKKREKRMKSKVPQQPETYQSLLEKEKKVSAEIAAIEKQLARAKTMGAGQSSSAEEDPLDSFMKELKDSKPDKQTISKLKTELATLKVEHANVVKLVNLVKPADLPPLVINNKGSSDQGGSGTSKAKALPIFGKRPKVKVQLPLKQSDIKLAENMVVDETEEEEEEEETVENKEDSKPTSSVCEEEQSSTVPEGDNEKAETKSDIPSHLKVYRKISELEKLMLECEFPPELQSYVVEVSDILQNVKTLTEQEGRIQSDKKTIMAKNRKVKKHIDNLLESYDEHHLVRICKELRRIYTEIQDMTEKQHMISAKIRILGMKIDLICKEVLKEIHKIKESETSSKITKNPAVANAHSDELIHLEDDEDDDKDENKHLSPDELEKRRKKNQRRIQHRKERVEIEKQKGYQEDAQKEDYNMWVPPSGQTGDGRTSLNEKYGY